MLVFTLKLSSECNWTFTVVPSNDVMCICDRYSIPHLKLCSTSNFVKGMHVRRTFEASVEALID